MQQEKGTPKISIVLPVYNAGRFLRPCVDSLVNQTMADMEIICVLDAPTDGSDRIMEEYALKDNRIRIIRNPYNLNIGESRNVGINAARGLYIGFSDHDDTHELDMFEKLYSASDSGQKELVLSDTLGIYGSQFPADEQALRMFTALVQRDLGCAPTKHLYRRDFIEKYQIRFVDNNVTTTEDLIFNAQVLSHAANYRSKIGFVPELLFKHVDTNGNSSGSYSYWTMDKTVNSLHQLVDIAMSTTMSNKERQDMLAKLTLMLLYSSFYREYQQNGLAKTLAKFGSIKRDRGIHSHIRNISPSKMANTFPKYFFAWWTKVFC